MNILYTLPAISTPHGGYRIVLEHLTRLQLRGHEVMLYSENKDTSCPWYPVTFHITNNKADIAKADIVVIGSPHSIWVEDKIQKHQKCFLFMQMDERIFHPHNKAFEQQCLKFYRSKFPLLHGSHWGGEVLHAVGRKGDTIYIDNGVNLQHFPLSYKPKDFKTVLVEGWEASNPAKDIMGIGPAVAAWLKRLGYKIIAYGFQPLKTMTHAVDHYEYRPDLKTMNDLYEAATILVKATRYDARALSPVEAMTKGTVTARAIILGDDDLMHQFNCLRCDYEAATLFRNAQALLTNKDLHHKLALNARCHVSNVIDWVRIIDQIEKIYLYS